MAMAITNVKVTREWLDSSPYSVSCDYQGKRYHVWVCPAMADVPADQITGVPEDSMLDCGKCLYKNPPLSVDRHDPEFFPTRQLNLHSTGNARIVVAMLRAAKQNDLYRLNDEKIKQRDREQIHKRIAERRQDREQQAAHEMLTLLRDLNKFLVASRTQSQLAASLRARLHNVIQSADFRHGEVLALDVDGCIIQWNADLEQPYNSGETIADYKQWLETNILTTEERLRIGLEANTPMMPKPERA